MVLELKTPHGAEFTDLRPLLPTLLSYILSFVYLGIYWNNHHHMLHTTERVNGTILWANMHLLFWLSLVPFVTAWMGQFPHTTAPVVCYGFILLMAAISYTMLQATIIRLHGPDSVLRSAVGKDIKGKVSIAAYLASLACAFGLQWMSYALFVFVAIIWFVPDSRIEKTLKRE